MILVIDDDELHTSIYVNDLHTTTGTEVIYRHPDDALAFVRSHAWEIEWILIDEVFDRLKATEFNGGTDLGKLINKEFNFIPLVLYTANDSSFTRSDEAHIAGFIKALEKNNLYRRTTIEQLDGRIQVLTEIEALQQTVNTVYGLEAFKNKQILRQSMRKQYVKDVLAGLSETDLNDLKRAMSFMHCKQCRFNTNEGNLSLQQLFKGWVDTSALSEEQVKILIEDESLLPDSFTFKNPDWQEEFKIYQQADHEFEKMEIEYQAFRILFDLYNMPLNDDESFALSPGKRLQYVSTSFGKSVSNSNIFRDKMIARRVLIACYHVAPDLSLAQMVALLTRGNFDTNIKRVKKSITNTKTNRGLEPHPVINKQLELKISDKRVQVASNTVLREEIKWYDFIVMYDSVKRCIEMMREFKPYETASIDSLEAFINYNFDINTKKLLKFCEEDNCRQLIPLMNYIIKRIKT